MPVQTLAPDATTEQILSVIEQDGAAIIRDAIDTDVVQRMTEEVMPYIEKNYRVKNDFTGRSTQRTGALVARTPTCRDLILNNTVLDCAR